MITGPPCAGKSTIAAALAADREEPTALVDLDAVRWQVRSGFLNPMAEIPPGDAALAQWQVAVDICGDMARRYRDVGYACVVDAPGIYPDGSIGWAPYQLATWQRALDGVPWKLAVLLPSVEVVCERAAARAGFREPPAPILRAIHGLMEQWRDVEGVTVVDATGLDVDETVARFRPLV